MKASDTELLKPVLIWLHEPGRELPDDVDRQRRRGRRKLARSTPAPAPERRRPGARRRRHHPRQRTHTPADELVEPASSGYLSRLNVTSTYWPGDDEVREALRTRQVYRRFNKAAPADAPRSDRGRVPARDQPAAGATSWISDRAHPPAEVGRTTGRSTDCEAEEARAEHVHRLGNLTLLTTSLNSKVSNGPWASKREALQQHDTLLLNSRLLSTLGGLGTRPASSRGQTP